MIVGDDPASKVYVRNKKKACEELGLHSEEYALPAETTQEELLALVDKLNKKPDIDGILVQLPLPPTSTRRRSSRRSRPTRTWTRFPPSTSERS